MSDSSGAGYNDRKSLQRHDEPGKKKRYERRGVSIFSAQREKKNNREKE
jgi:hypothetical protein